MSEREDNLTPKRRPIDMDDQRAEAARRRLEARLAARGQASSQQRQAEQPAQVRQQERPSQERRADRPAQARQQEKPARRQRRVGQAAPQGGARIPSSRAAGVDEASGAEGGIDIAAFFKRMLSDKRVLIVIAALVVLALVGVIVAFATGSSSGGQDSSASASAESESAEAVNPYKATEPYSISFTTTGDLIFWREVADYIDLYGGAAAMENIADFLAQSDVTISNLESPLSDDESEPVYNKDVYIIGRPSAIESLINSGIDVVSLANNHIMDYTGPALQDTLDALDEAGILHAGAGMTESQAETPVEMTVNGATIAFFSWTDVVPDYFVAYGDEPGVVSARLAMEDTCRRVREAKETHDIVIVAMHWGTEYEDYINDYQQRDPAHELVDAGADVVLGNHPHVMEGVEFYNGSLIAYAHGNCVFWQRYDHTHESIVLNFDITQDGIENVVATPLYLDDEYGIPSISTGEQAQITLERLQEISEGMNVNIEIADDKAYITPLS